ncbi:Tellurite resistance protein TerB [Nannocystis exedens]|uniref:Tellurite resistance protein TerB n=1 Tax=Nannocystis exedens TaxID=54 RepID=A0A1I1SWQ5_9BACT|nr:TerB family tellurite resistance protein [Nannocystis exedens]PCC75584.1 Tellurite resistance protein TerB [Nannocystis exedens]SFD47460.1 Tellurite resistance protein TerB [Nannocystis exedens]
MSVTPSDNEDAYFQQRERELREQLREQLDKAAGELRDDRQKDTLSLSDRIAALGFTGEKLKVFDLLPLVHVAWADGSVSRKERTAILDVLRGRGIQPGTEAFRTVESLLEERPSQAFLDQSLAVLKEAVGGARAANIVDLCVQVAGASGGFLNMGTVSDEERALIQQIANQLGGPAIAEFNKQLG